MPGWRRPLSARFADKPEDFANFGIQPKQVQAFEDGMRTEGGPGGFEWWYFDFHLSDGSLLVIVFFTKEMMNPGGKLAPFFALDFDRPGQPLLHFEVCVSPDAFSASRDRCDVRVGESTFRGDLNEYLIHISHNDVTIDLKLTGQVPAWRPASGHMVFGEPHEHFFAWLLPVPQGNVVADLNIRGKRERLEGVGYHDHNWGDVPLKDLLNHWHWGRAQAGDYSIVASYFMAEKAYGSTALPAFMLAKAGKIIADDARKVRFHLEDEQMDPTNRKPVANVVVYEYQDGPECYRVSYRRSKTLVSYQLITRLRGFKYLLARLARFDGSYMRFTGHVRLEHFVNGKLVEDVSDIGIWEMIYFGRPRRRADGI
jgi:hypothetical protein